MYANQLTPASRAMLGAKYRINAAYAGPLAAAYAHARTAEPLGTLLVRQDDAQAAADHIGGLYATQRRLVTVTLRWGAYQVGQVGFFNYPRYGLDRVKGIIVGTDRDFVNRTVKLTIWI